MCRLCSMVGRGNDVRSFFDIFNGTVTRSTASRVRSTTSRVRLACSMCRLCSMVGRARSKEFLRSAIFDPTSLIISLRRKNVTGLSIPTLFFGPTLFFTTLFFTTLFITTLFLIDKKKGFSLYRRELRSLGLVLSTQSLTCWNFLTFRGRRDFAASLIAQSLILK